MCLLRGALGLPLRTVAANTTRRFCTASVLPPVPRTLAKAQDVRSRLDDAKAAALLGGGEARISAQHAKGKLTARERLELMVDPGTFREYDMLKTHRCEDFGVGAQRPAGDGVVTGHGKIGGRTVFVFSQDFTVFGGSLGEAHAEKVRRRAPPPHHARPLSHLCAHAPWPHVRLSAVGIGLPVPARRFARSWTRRSQSAVLPSPHADPSPDPKPQPGPAPCAPNPENTQP